MENKNEWKKVKLGEIVTITMGQSPKSEFYNLVGEGVPFLQGNRTFGKKFPSFDTYTTKVTKIAKKNDVIMSVRAPIGDLNLATTDICLGRGVCSLRMNNGNYEFLFYLLKYYSKQLINNGNGTVFTSINRNEIYNLEINIPNNEFIQKKISKILSDIDNKIELNNKINNNLEKQLQLLYKHWFIDLEPFNSNEIANWKYGKLKDILNLEKRIFKKENNIEFPYLPIDVIPMHSFAIKEVKPFSEAQSSLIKFLKDDILIGAMRVYFHRVVIAPFDGITRNTCFTLSVKEKEYLSFALICCNLKNTIKFAEKTSKGTTMPYATWENGLSEMDLLIPPIEIAKKFNISALPLIRKIQNSYFENKRLNNLKNYLLPKLMNGEIDVENIEL